MGKETIDIVEMNYAQLKRHLYTGDTSLLANGKKPVVYRKGNMYTFPMKIVNCPDAPEKDNYKCVKRVDNEMIYDF